ncbi:hypothetical protein HGA64_01970 [Candidatus Falkowbacteria bacterium]|nr:hypothetical protein [Candidatus Falkowbacteria bacterium]
MKIQANIPYKKILTYIYILLVIMGVTAIAYTVYFLYQNFFQTMTRSSEVVDLKGKVAIESVNVKKFELVQNSIKNKKAIPLPDLKNLTFK